MLTLRQLKFLLANFGCDCQLVARGESLEDPTHTDSLVPDLYAFTRVVDGRQLVSTVHSYHEGLPQSAFVVRSLLARLEITPEELWGP